MDSEKTNTVKEFAFGYDLDAIKNVQEHLQTNWIEGKDYKMHKGMGDDVMNSLSIYNPQMLKDHELLSLIEDCECSGNFDEVKNSDRSWFEQLKFDQICKDFISEDYGFNDSTEGPGPKLDSKTGEAEDWKSHMGRNIVKAGNDFLRSCYELGYTGEAGDSDIEHIINILAKDHELDDRNKQHLSGIVEGMIRAGHSDL